MILWFIRHAIAVDGETFHGSDVSRPLTASGRRQAKQMFEALARVRPGPQLVFASEAVRAWETAEILCLSYRLNHPERTPLLNPGCTGKKLKGLLKSLAGKADRVALVGHEPDFSRLISRLTAKESLSIRLKKCALAEVELGKKGLGTLTMLIPPDVMNL